MPLEFTVKEKNRRMKQEVAEVSQCETEYTKNAQLTGVLNDLNELSLTDVTAVITAAPPSALRLWDKTPQNCPVIISTIAVLASCN